MSESSRSDVMTIRTYEAQTYRIWVCRCPRRFWAERPAHLTCADCGRLICEIEVAQVGVRP